MRRNAMTRYRLYMTNPDGSRLAYFLGSIEEVFLTAKSILTRVPDASLRVSTDTFEDKTRAALALATARRAVASSVAPFADLPPSPARDRALDRWRAS